LKLIIIILLFTSVLSAKENISNKNNPKKEIILINQELNLKTKKEIAKKEKFYYFNPDKLGVHAFYNPIQFIVEGGLPGNKNLKEVQLLGGFKDLFEELTHPVSRLNRYGWGKFFYYEFIPHWGKHQNYVPNYVMHTLGGGFRTKLMEEYFRYNNYKYPKVFAWITMTTMNYFNEATQLAYFRLLSDGEHTGEEFNDIQNDTVDALADVYFFDILGKIIFSFDPVNDFFTKRLHLTEWSYQSQWNPATNKLINNGQIYWMRLHIYDKWSVNYTNSVQINALGLSYEFKKGNYISVGAGANVSNFFQKTESGDLGLTKDSLNYQFGIYYSIDDNPVFLLTYKIGNKQAIKDNPEFASKFTDIIYFNVYPGWIKGFNYGINFSYQKEAFFVGITSGSSPIGFIFSTPQKKMFIESH